MIMEVLEKVRQMTVLEVAIVTVFLSFCVMLCFDFGLYMYYAVWDRIEEKVRRITHK